MAWPEYNGTSTQKVNCYEKNTSKKFFSRLVVYDEWFDFSGLKKFKCRNVLRSQLVVHVAMDNVLISDDVSVVAAQPFNKEVKHLIL